MVFREAFISHPGDVNPIHFQAGQPLHHPLDSALNVVPDFAQVRPHFQTGLAGNSNVAGLPGRRLPPDAEPAPQVNNAPVGRAGVLDQSADACRFNTEVGLDVPNCELFAGRYSYREDAIQIPVGRLRHPMIDGPRPSAYHPGSSRRCHVNVTSRR